MLFRCVWGAVLWISYDDFFIASKEEAQKQFDNAESIVAAIIEYMCKNNSGTII